MDRSKFIEKSKTIHGDKYDYSKVEYVNCSTDVMIICPEHGEFWQKPSNHLHGYGCPVCANKNRGKKRLNTNIFIERAKKIHGDKYDYSKVNYIDAKTKVVVICKEHGEFEQLPFAHLSGQCCPKCKGIGLNSDEIINKFKSVHGDKYDYSKSTIDKIKGKITIICKEHGEFRQSPQKHISGQGCPVCAKKNRTDKTSISYAEFLERAQQIHGSKYEYIEDSYTNLHSKLEIKCNKHGIYRQYAYDHLDGHGCPVCGLTKSECENEIYEHIVSIVGQENVVKGDRNILNGKEIDIYIPSIKVGIEYNGCIWHSEKFGKDRYYHLNKTEACKTKGIRLIQVFEDEYKNSKEIVLSKIDNILMQNKSLDKVYGRKCNIMEIDCETAKTFLNKNHIQGYAGAKIHLGCYYDNILVGVMSFKHENGNNWNLVRFASDIAKHCIGIGGKLFNFFVKNYNPCSVKTFADRRWTLDIENNLYTKLGFQLKETLKPDYRYVTSSNINRAHKFNFRKSILSKKYGLDQSLTEKQMCDIIGVYKIWDCGLYRYEWEK